MELTQSQCDIIQQALDYLTDHVDTLTKQELDDICDIMVKTDIEYARLIKQQTNA